MSGELTTSSALEIGALIERGDVTATEVLEAHLARIEAENPRLNAIVTLSEARARAAAAEADARAAAQSRLGPLDGVPFTVKDVIATAGIRTTLGSALFAEHVPTWTATAVERLAGAGAVLLGKSNTPEFGLDPHTDNLIFGPTVNPLDPDRSPGGSSGGEGAAVAAGLSAFGIGTDYGGSVRWPSQCNGINGLRPTPGLVPGTGLLPSDEAMSRVGPSSVSLLGATQVIGPLARSVADLEAITGAMAGFDSADPRSVPTSPERSSRVSVASLSCAWLDGDGTVPVERDLVAVVEAAALRLTPRLQRVEPARPDGFVRAEPLYAELRRADGLALLQRLARGRESELTETMRTWFEEVEPTSVAAFQALTAERDLLRARTLEFMETYPIMLLLVSTAPAPRLGAADFHARFEMLAPSRAISLLGLPSVAVTCGGGEHGEPLAVQVVARPFREHEALAVARSLCDAVADG